MPTFKRADQEQMEKAKDLVEESSAEMGFCKSLYFGRLHLDKLLPYPRQDYAEARRTDELLTKLDAFIAAEVDADRIDAEERIPQNVIDGLGKLGLLGMTVPAEYGGGGFSHTAYCRAVERVSRTCASTAVLIGAHQSIGLKAILLMGTEAQKQKYLPHLATGDMLAAFCLSEPEVGSDAANVQTSARLSDDGSHWILNGHKRYATNSALAKVMTVMAKTLITENGKTRDKVTAFLVTPDLPGFEIVSPNRSKCGVRGSWQGTLRFTDMPVPAVRVLGQVGGGLKVALNVLNYGRCTLSAGCLGGAKKALEMSIERARTRRQFGREIGRFHLIKQKIAQMAETVFAMDAMTYLCAGLVDRHAPDIALETAIAKLFCSEGSWQVIDDAVQIWGGEGYMREHGLKRMLRDARINRIVEGTTEVMTAFVALLGMKGVGEQFEQVLRAGKHPIGNFGRLAQFAKEQWRDIVVGADCRTLSPEIEAEGHALARLTHQFAQAVHRLLRTHREKILDMQLIHQRIAWSAVDLFAMAAVLSKLQTQLVAAAGNGHGTSLPQDLMIGRSFCHHAAGRIHTTLHSLFANRDAETLAVADGILGWHGSDEE
jgi:acyl-CoA dehydrogenase family protein 9